MPKISEVGRDARTRLKGTGRPNPRAPYIEALDTLEGDQTLEITPDESETLRMIRANLTRAAKEVGKAIKSGETQEGTLLVWLAEPSKAGPTPVKRTRRKRNADGVLV